MTNKEYYAYDHIEVEGEFDQMKADKPITQITDDGRYRITKEVIGHKTAVAEIDAADGKFEQQNCRDGGTFSISVQDGEITKRYDFQLLGHRRYTAEGFPKYRPYVVKTTYVRLAQ